MRHIIQKTAPYSHRSSEIFCQALSLKKHYILASSLPPLSKVRCCRPKKFGRLPEGLLYTHRASQSPQPSQKHINRFAPHHVLASLVKGELLSPKKFVRLPEGLLPIRTNPPKTALSLAPHNILTPLAKGELLLLSFAQPTIEDSSHQHRRKHFAY